MNKAIVIATVSIVAVLVLLPVVARAIRGDAPAAAAQDSQTAFADQETTQLPAASPPPLPTDGTPAVVNMNPENGATNVSAQTAQLIVTFNVPMRGGFSWTGGGPEFPETTGKPYWAADQQTCVLPVHLKPNWSYRVGLNSPSHKNFKSANGIPLPQVVWRFSTGAN